MGKGGIAGYGVMGKIGEVFSGDFVMEMSHLKVRLA